MRSHMWALFWVRVSGILLELVGTGGHLLGIRVNVEPIHEIGPKVGCGHWVLFRDTVHHTHYVHFNVAKAC